MSMILPGVNAGYPWANNGIIPNVQPFTYSDALTNADILAYLKRYLEETRAYVNTFPDEVAGSISQMIVDVESRLNTQNTWVDGEIAELTQFVNNSIASVINNSIELQDAVAAGLIEDSASATGQAAKAKIEVEALTGRNGKQNVFLAGVIRNMDDGLGWQLLPISTNHRPINIDSVETDSVEKKIRINYAGLGATTTVLFMAVPDETLARAGFIMGSSVTEARTDIFISQAMRQVSDYISWDGVEFTSQNGNFEPITYDEATNTITLSHSTIPLESIYSLSVVPRTREFTFTASDGTMPYKQNSIDLKISQTRPPVGGYVSYNGTEWALPEGFTNPSFLNGVLTVEHASIPSSVAEEISISSRGQYSCRVSASGSPLTSTAFKVEFYNAAGALVTVPDANCRAFIKRGTSRVIGAAPTAEAKFTVAHGGGIRIVDPATISNTNYPNGNIWLFGIMEM